MIMKTLVPIKKSYSRSSRRGAVMVEYVFVLIFIVIIALVGIKTFGNTVNNKMGSNNNSVANAIQ